MSYRSNTNTQDKYWNNNCPPQYSLWSLLYFFSFSKTRLHSRRTRLWLFSIWLSVHRETATQFHTNESSFKLSRRALVGPCHCRLSLISIVVVIKGGQKEMSQSSDEDDQSTQLNQPTDHSDSQSVNEWMDDWIICIFLSWWGFSH